MVQAAEAALSPFLVVGLPRSRTAWLAKFLSYQGRVCRHEPSLRWESLADFARWLDGSEGASDTMMTFLAHEVQRRRPDIPLLVIRRPRFEVLESLNRLPYKKEPWLPAWLEKMDARLDRIEDELDCFVLNFHELDLPMECRLAGLHCLGVLPDPRYVTVRINENVQADINETQRLVKENEAGWRSVYDPFMETA
jgi:hypothetical protein